MKSGRTAALLAAILLSLAACKDDHPTEPSPEQQAQKQPAQTGPFDELGGIKLGTHQLDLTLTHGRPQCTNQSYEGEFHGILGLLRPYPSGVRALSPREVMWGYTAFDDCGLALFIDGRSEERAVSRLCTYKAPSALGFLLSPSEQDVLAKLGKPSSVSINGDGTKRISNFDVLHLSINAEGGTIQQWCVSEQPMRFAQEYAGG
jgi:hypothetical protein